MFGRRSVRAKDVGISSLHGVQVRPDQVLVPRLRVCPMSWVWAVFWCQLCVQRAISTVPTCSDQSRLVDGRPTPRDNDMRAIYIDNSFDIGSSCSAVKNSAKLGNTSLKAAGLIVHEEELSEDNVMVLG